ncbi:MAG: hypothetical protein ACLFVP_08260, partial [Candidatus Bathyarchaeia archaeon]
ILISRLQGLIIDVALIITGRKDWSIYLACGLASISNVAYLQFFLSLPLPGNVYKLIYLLAFSSGILCEGIWGKKLYEMIETRIPLRD